jgi:hypothetical protein
MFPSRRLLAAAIGGLVLPSVGAVPLALPALAAELPPVRVVAVGDSYASGEGAMGTAWSDPSCHRSTLAAPEEAARRQQADRPVTFTSLACSGTFTGSATGAGGMPGVATRSLLGAEGQLVRVGAPGERVDALSLSIGGNDIGFADLVFSCSVPVYDCSADPRVTGPLQAALAALPARLDEVAAAIQGPAGTRLVPAEVGDVFVTPYPDPTMGAGGARCGSPEAPAFGGLDGVDAVEAAYASASVVAPLNAALAGLVDRANAAPGDHPAWHLVDLGSRLAGHGYCTGPDSPVPAQQAGPRFINTVADSITSQGDVYGTLHPDPAGQLERAAALYDAEHAVLAPEPGPEPEPEPGGPDGSCRLCDLVVWFLSFLAGLT